MLSTIDKSTLKTNERADLPRCQSCRAYVNPFFEFLNNFANFKCNLCEKVQQTPGYYANIRRQATKEGIEEQQHPEQYHGTYELVANDDYTARPPKDPTYYFLIDISKSSYDANIPFYAIAALKEAIENERLNEGANIGIAFYDTMVHIVELGDEPKLFSFLPNVNQPYKLPPVY